MSNNYHWILLGIAVGILLYIIDKYIFPSFVSTERYYNGLKDNLNTINNKIYFVPTLAMFKISELLKTY